MQKNIVRSKYIILSIDKDHANTRLYNKSK